MLKKIKVAYRFGDLETAFGFAEENKIPYDEVILLFDHVEGEEEVEEATEKAELPKMEIDKDKLIKDLMKEKEDLMSSRNPEKNKPVGVKPKKAGFNPFRKEDDGKAKVIPMR